MISINALTQQQYINLETFRKSGVGIKTPVWFVQDGDTLFVRTVADFEQGKAHPQQWPGKHRAVQIGWHPDWRVDRGECL